MTPRRKTVVGAGDHVDYDTARPRHLDPAEQAAKDAQRRNALGNLAAMRFEAHGVDVAGEAAYAGPASLLAKVAGKEIVELADMLGLTDAPRQPGACQRCGSPIPLSMATKHHGKAHGLCSPCRKTEGTTE